MPPARPALSLARTSPTCSRSSQPPRHPQTPPKPSTEPRLSNASTNSSAIPQNSSPPSPSKPHQACPSATTKSSNRKLPIRCVLAQWMGNLSSSRKPPAIPGNPATFIHRLVPTQRLHLVPVAVAKRLAEPLRRGLIPRTNTGHKLHLHQKPCGKRSLLLVRNKQHRSSPIRWSHRKQQPSLRQQRIEPNIQRLRRPRIHIQNVARRQRRFSP